MFSKRMSRIAQVVLIATLCLAPMAQAGVRTERNSKPATSRAQVVLQSFWHGLVSLFYRATEDVHNNDSARRRSAPPPRPCWRMRRCNVFASIG